MDRKKFFIFLILFEFIIISLFSNFNKVSAATTLEWKDLPSGCPTPTEVYNSLPDDQKSLVSPDKYAFYCVRYTRVTSSSTERYWKRYSYIFISGSSHFADYGGSFISDSDYVVCTFHDFNSEHFSKPDNWEFSSNILPHDNWTNVYRSISISDYDVDYYFSTFNIYDNRPYSDDNIRFLQATPPAPSMGEIVLQHKDKVLKQVVLLLPIVLVTLVLLIGLRKALQMLMNFLRKS